MKKGKVKTKTLVIVVISTLIICLVLGVFLFLYAKNEAKKELKYEKKELVQKVKEHYNKYVKTLRDAKIYKKVKGDYKVVGKIASNIPLTLKDIKINYKTKYFKIEGLNLFIKFSDVKIIDSINPVDYKYKRYILFNENVRTKNKVRLYKDDNVVYTFDYAFDFPIIIKDNDKVGIEFNNDLYYIKNEDIASIYQHSNSNSEIATEIPVTVYHFIYLHGEVCNDIICHSEDQIKSHFEYLSNNNYTTITSYELLLWNEGKINLPKNTVMVTIDDGARAEKFIPFLEQYKIYATLFLVTSWYPTSNFKSDYLDIQSHSDNLHIPGVCSGEQGSPLKCLPTDELVNDLKISREKTSAIAFCFPFYEFNDHAIDAVKKAGFYMSFIGGQEKMLKGSDLYKIPRITFHSNDTLDYYISMIS